MKLIVGLGNPEKDYKWTRHNVGFEVINKLAYDYNININKAKFRAHIGEGSVAGKSVIMAKPQTYMNLSGESVRDIVNYFKLTAEDMVVIFDDISLDVGEIRVRERGSAGGHNGMKNIIRELGTDEFVRVRIGIGDKPPGWDLADYVLSKFDKSEHEAIVDGITKASEAVEIILRDGSTAAMDTFNKRKPIRNGE